MGRELTEIHRRFQDKVSEHDGLLEETNTLREHCNALRAATVPIASACRIEIVSNVSLMQRQRMSKYKRTWKKLDLVVWLLRRRSKLPRSNCRK